MGSGPFARRVLEVLLAENRFNISTVVSQPARIQGRKKLLVKTPVGQFVENLDCKYFECANSKDILEVIKPNEYDFLLVCDYGVLLKQEVIDLPTKDTLNIHGSLLPKYRGASPIQEALKNGDLVTGVSLQSMVLKLDAGDVYAESELKIPKDMLFEELRDQLAWLGAKLVLQTLEPIYTGSLVSKPQELSLVSHCSKISKEDAEVFFNSQTAENIYNKFRAFSSWPKIYFHFRNMNIIIHDCVLSDLSVPTNLEPGLFFVEDKRLFVVCSDGVLEICELQLPSKAKTLVSQFLNGRPNYFTS